ncbi:putative serine/threonine-protein kinase [Dichanthelium oligosanthes]|uniref:[RNA-polymerase]-subunit kinase n=1 Tax=Dichanthelium oligosanthes TaxID=888268 RepID=A0A1E5V0Z5_9POAL|nr:putative serine/threonine-protein kinase [Dichanthelium oligosanthes]
MGGLCSKEGVVDAPPAAPAPGPLQKAPSQSLKQLITLAAKEEDAPVVHAVISRTAPNSNAKASNGNANGGAAIAPAPAPAAAKEAVEKTAPPVVVITSSLSKSYSTAGAPTHHRRATVDIGGNNNNNGGVAGADHGTQHQIGQGTYSNVYKARDLQSGKIVALKRVRFVNMDPESVRFMAREIAILRRLDHPNVIKLEGIVTSRLSHSLYLVFEYMEHDLAGLAALSGQRFTEPQVKCFMAQILEGLRHCHARGVLHRDIKGSNLLIDDNGQLRIADFGLATFFDPAKRQPMTSRVVTLWYRPPELLLGATEYGVAVDLWSTGCILAELLAGKPIMPGQTEIEQLHKIFKLCGSPSEDYWAKAKLPDVTLFKPQRPYRRKIAETFKDFPPTALELLDTLLAIEPSARGTAASALDSQFFRTKPLACDPASLPKYPPCKEYDAKLRGQEASRQNTTAIVGKGSVSVKPGRDDAKAAPAQDAITDYQRRHARANQKSTSHHYSSQEDSVPGFRIEPPPGAAGRGPATMQTAGFGSTWYRNEQRGVPRTSSSVRASQLTSQRSYVPSRGTDLHPSTSAARNANSRYNRLDVAEPGNAVGRPGSSHQKDLGMRDTSAGFGGKNKRIHYSGPLMPPGGNMEDMLKEHERQIQQAVRKARVEKEKTNRHHY